MDPETDETPSEEKPAAQRPEDRRQTTEEGEMHRKVRPEAADTQIALDTPSTVNATAGRRQARPFYNDTAAMLAPLVAKGLKVSVGRLSYGTPRVSFQPHMPNAQLTIGSFCSIGGGCKIFVGGFGRHLYDFATTSPLAMFYRNVSAFDRSEALQGDLTVSIGSDVWIGEDVTILAGVRVGHGAVIGTRSLVTGEVPPYAIVGGVPARLIRFRFGDHHIARFLRCRWWEWDDATIDENVELFYTADIDRVLERFEEVSKLTGTYRHTQNFWF